MRQYHGYADYNREWLRSVVGDEADQYSDAELNDSTYSTLFPNFAPWGGFGRIVYRWRPNGDNHEECIMELMLLAPWPEGKPKPPPAAVHELEPDEPWTNALELGNLGRIIDQDMINLPKVYLGLKTKQPPSVWMSSYQEGVLRNWHAICAHAGSFPRAREATRGAAASVALISCMSISWLLSIGRKACPARLLQRGCCSNRQWDGTGSPAKRWARLHVEEGSAMDKEACPARLSPPLLIPAAALAQDARPAPALGDHHSTATNADTTPIWAAPAAATTTTRARPPRPTPTGLPVPGTNTSTSVTQKTANPDGSHRPRPRPRRKPTRPTIDRGRRCTPPWQGGEARGGVFRAMSIRKAAY